VLPNTGGSGIGVYLITGSILLAIGAVGLIFYLRRRRKK